MRPWPIMRSKPLKMPPPLTEHQKDLIIKWIDGDPCSIVFGHNAEIRKVLMKFSVTASQLVFSPEEAEDVAEKLKHYAKAARGQKPS
jgi:hypothetical protein